MANPVTSSSRNNSKDARLVFVSTGTAVFSEASRKAARSHAAAWSRRRLKEAKAKPKANQDLGPVGDDSGPSKDLETALPSDKLPHQTRPHSRDKKKGSNDQSTREQPEGHLSLSVRSDRSDAKQRTPRRKSLLFKRGNLSNLSLAVCGSSGSLDPFDSLAVKVDSNVYDLLQFYERSPSMAWDSQPYAPTHNNPSGSNGSIVSSCMSSKLHFYAFLSLSAALMETLGITEITFPRAALYSQYALTEIRLQLRNEQVKEPELLQGVSTLSIAAALQDDVTAARAHLRAAKYLVERLGGLEALMPLIAQRIRYGDFHLAIETLSPPIFMLDFEPPGFPAQKYEPDSLLEQMMESAVQSSWEHLPPCLFENVQRIIQCVGVLEGI